MRRTTMNLYQLQRRTSLALCFLALAGIAHGQAQQGAQFEPQVGQAGKDVVWVPTPQELVNKMLDLAK
ncbi:MAG TPA: SAM-dependent methyltransferase, partial [Candidatus Binatia bacterium]|nr:SAM-dependent methyltransferase [Candidatus Binatia bacterium]